MRVKDNKEYIIFGAGNIGNRVLKYCKLCRFNVVAIVDNDKEKWGNKIHRIQIMNPKEAIVKFPDSYFFISSQNFYHEIEKQLIELGVSGDRIEIFRSEHDVQVKIYEKRNIRSIRENKYFIFDREQYVTAGYCLRKVLSVFQCMYYKFLMTLLKPQVTEKKYNVSIAAIFRDETDYLKEWIEYHRLAGIDHFYLYNNFSKDNYMDILKPYIEKDIVTLTEWPVEQGQMQAYEDCVTRFSHETKWIGFFDLDEFVVSKQYKKIYDFLVNFEKKRPLVLVYWKHFGTSGRMTRDVKKGLVVEDFTVGWYKYVDIGKLFFNTAYTYLPHSKHNKYMHYMWAKYKSVELPPVNVFDKVCLYEFNPVPNKQMPVQLNHYLLKSYQEYTERKTKRGGGVNKIGVHNEKYFIDHEAKSQTADFSAYKYLIPLKKKMWEFE